MAEEPEARDFRDAAIMLLEAACRGLISEHQQILAGREASLQSEIRRLEQEVSSMRINLNDRIVQARRSSLDPSAAEEGSSLVPYGSPSMKCHGTWLTDAPKPVSLNVGKSTAEATPTFTSKPLLGEEPSRLNAMDILGSHTFMDVVGRCGPADLLSHRNSLETVGCRGSTEVVVRGKSLEAERMDIVDHRSSTDVVGRGSSKEGSMSVLGSGSMMRPDPCSSLELKNLSSDDEVGIVPRAGGRGRSFISGGQTSLRSSETHEQPHAAWKRTADTVIEKAGSQFFGVGVGSTDMHNLAFIQRIRQDRFFQARMVEGFIGLVICLNTLTIGISSELQPEWIGWVVIDSLFAGIFTGELFYKLWLLGIKGYCCGSEWRWNDFEFCLVIVAWIEVGSMAQASEVVSNGPKSSLFRMLRLMRLAKLLRILRLQIFCDLLMMVNGAIGSWKTLLYSGVLIFIPLYGAALILKETLGTYANAGQGAEPFLHLEEAFFTLFRCMVASDCTQEDGKPIFVMVTKAYGWSFGLFYCLVQFLMTFGLFNVIVAIYVENTVSAAKFNDTFVKRQKLRDREYFEEKAQELLQLIWRYYGELRERQSLEMEAFNEDTANKLELTQEFFEELCTKQEFTDILRDLDISEDDQLDLFETLDVEGVGSIDLMNFVVGIGKLRGEARKADVIAVSLLLRSMQHKLVQMETRFSTRSQKPSRKTGVLASRFEESSASASSSMLNLRPHAEQPPLPEQAQ